MCSAQRQAEDEDDVVQVQDDCCHLAEFPLVIFTFLSLLLLGLLDLVHSGLQLRGRPSTEIPEGRLTNGHKIGKVPGQIYLLVVSKDLCFGLSKTRRD